MPLKRTPETTPRSHATAERANEINLSCVYGHSNLWVDRVTISSKTKELYKTRKCLGCENDTHRAWKYNTTREKINKLVSDSQGRCAICKTEAKLFVDHNHETGKVRGMLCIKCNTQLAVLEDTSLMMAMWDYLDREVLLLP